MRFDDGTVVEVAHRYALRILYNKCEYGIGFENACEKSIDRLIHKSSMKRISVEGEEVDVSEEERSILLSRVVEYCEKNKLKYRIT
jgi:hypothetical protein